MIDKIINKDNYEVKRNKYFKYEKLIRKIKDCISWTTIITLMVLIFIIWIVGWLYPLYRMSHWIDNADICTIIQIIYGIMYLIISAVITFVFLQD